MNHRHAAQRGNYQSSVQPVFQNARAGLGGWPFGKRNAMPQWLSERAKNSVIGKLPNDVLDSLLPVVELVHFKSGEYVYRPDDQIHYLYFPETLVVSEFQILEDGKTIETALIGRESLLGIASLFKTEVAPNWTQALIAGSAWRVDARAFRLELTGDGQLQSALFDFVNQHIGHLARRVTCINHHSVEQRFCAWLLMVCDRCDSETLPLTHEQIARFLGVQRPSITLIAQGLREQGVIDYRRGKIIISDRERLRELSCGCHTTPEENWH